MPDTVVFDSAAIIGVITGVLAVIGVIGNWLRLNGRTKWLDAIKELIGLAVDVAASFLVGATVSQMIYDKLNGVEVDPVEAQRKLDEQKRDASAMWEHVTKLREIFGV